MTANAAATEIAAFANRLAQEEKASAALRAVGLDPSELTRLTEQVTLASRGMMPRG